MYFRVFVTLLNGVETSSAVKIFSVLIMGCGCEAGGFDDTVGLSPKTMTES